MSVKRILGIDPGLNVTGYAVIVPARPHSRVIEAGVIRPGSSDLPMATRLDRLHRGILELIEALSPDCMAMEQVHSQPKFPQTAILMAHARGVIMLAAAQKGLSVEGYPAARIKKTLTGSGRAPKEQMQRAIQVELGLDRLPEPHDVADACAIALCHGHTVENARLTSGLGL
ncbi:MAG: crossover junction endodeoxyribonuclease RuvC [Isosphaeraceae bacterium]